MKIIERILKLLGKIKMKCKSKCCESSCMLNDENNLDHNSIDGETRNKN